MSKLNILYGTSTAILAVVFFLSTFSLPSEQRGLDPRVYPRFVSLCFFALSVGLVTSSVRSRKEKEKEKEKGKGFKEAFRSAALQRVGGMFLVALGYVAIIDTVGYLVATPPFLAGSMVLFGERRVWKILLVSLLSTAILFWLFRIIFRVPLPVSSLW